MPGSTASITAYGPVAAGALLLGTPIEGIDLHVLGGLAASGCVLHTQPFVSLPTFFAPIDATPPFGYASYDFELPADVSASAVSFRAQFATLSTPLITSNALDCTTSATTPSLGMSMVHASQTGSAPPQRGNVRSGRAPVLRFDW